MSVIRLVAPEGAPRIRLFPGSKQALKKGCLCPEEQPGWPSVDVDLACPVHQLERETIH